MRNSIYATPRLVDVGECDFYHTMDLPGHGTVVGDWDLREGVEEYLGGVDFKGTRVLEIGPASGSLCFEMERLGAEVVCYDLSEKQSWDLVPYGSPEDEVHASQRANHIRRLNNGYWFAHRAHKSRARVVYGTVYDLPEDIGMVDISTFGCVLLHVRDPFLALQRALRLTKKTVIVIEQPPRTTRLMRLFRFFGVSSLPSRHFTRSAMQFLPNYHKGEPKCTWWGLTPEVVLEFLGVLGFRDARVTYHEQRYRGGREKLYTIVAHRT